MAGDRQRRERVIEERRIARERSDVLYQELHRLIRLTGALAPQAGAEGQVFDHLTKILIALTEKLELVDKRLRMFEDQEPATER